MKRKKTEIKLTRKHRHLRTFDSKLFDKKAPAPPAFCDVFEQLILPKLTLTGYKVNVKKIIASRFAHQLIVASLYNRVLAASRTPAKTSSIEIQIADQFIAAGLAIVCIGSKISEKTSMYTATSQLTAIQNNWPPKQTRLTDDRPLVLVKCKSSSNDTDSVYMTPNQWYRKQRIGYKATKTANAIWMTTGISMTSENS